MASRYNSNQPNGGEETLKWNYGLGINKKNTIWIHTHEHVITTYKANRTAITVGRRQIAETLTEKRHIVSAEIITNPDTIVLLYRVNHYTIVIREDTNDRLASRKRTTEVCQEEPPTGRERPAKIKTRIRKRKSGESK